MRLPWVSRERLEEAQRTIAERDSRINALEDYVLDLVDKIVEIKVEPLSAARPKRDFAYPPKVEEAIRERSIPGSRLEGELRSYARSKLEYGDTDPEEVAREILVGSDAFKDEDW